MNQGGRIRQLLDEKREISRAFRKVVAACRQSNKDNSKIIKALKRATRELDYLRGYSQAMSECHEETEDGPRVFVSAEPLKAAEIHKLYEERSGATT